MKEYQSLSHTRWDCKYHIVFIPKRRKSRIFGAVQAEDFTVAGLHNTPYVKLAATPEISLSQAIKDKASTTVFLCAGGLLQRHGETSVPLWQARLP